MKFSSKNAITTSESSLFSSENAFSSGKRKTLVGVIAGVVVIAAVVVIANYPGGPGLSFTCIFNGQLDQSYQSY